MTGCRVRHSFRWPPKEPDTNVIAWIFTGLAAGPPLAVAVARTSAAIPATTANGTAANSAADPNRHPTALGPPIRSAPHVNPFTGRDS